MNNNKKKNNVVNIQDYFQKEMTIEDYIERFITKDESFKIEGSIKDKLNVLTALSKALSFKIAQNSLGLMKEYTYSTVLSANVVYIKVSMMDDSDLFSFILDEVLQQLGDSYSDIIEKQVKAFEGTGIAKMCYNLLSIIAESSEELDGDLDPELIIDFTVTTLENFYKSCEFKTLSRDQLDSYFEDYPESFVEDVSEYLSDYENVDSAIEASVNQDDIYDEYKLRDIAFMIDSYNQIVGDSSVRLLGYYRGPKDSNYKEITDKNHYLKLKNYKVILLYKDLETGRIITTKRISNEEDMQSIQIVIDATNKEDIPFSISNYLDNEGGDY